MYKVTATVQYKIPHNEACNLPSGKLCRFCIIDGMQFRCALHDQPLQALSGIVYKCSGCLDCMNGTQVRIDDPIVDIEPERIVKHTVNEFCRVYKALRHRRFSEGMSLEMAKEQVTKPDIML